MRFIGNVRQQRPLPHSIISGGEAAIDIRVSVAGNQDVVPFLIDSGAEVTVLGPNATLDVLGPAALGINFARDSRSLRLLGIGGGANHIVRDAELTLRSSEGELYSIEMPVLLAEPQPPPLSDPFAPQPPSPPACWAATSCAASASNSSAENSAASCWRRSRPPP